MAADEVEPTPGGWKGEGELGFTSISGNSDEENLNASLAVSKESDQWRHTASLNSIRNESDTSLKVRIVGNLAAKISYLLKRNSEVPSGIDKSDKITTISLVYAF